MSNIISDISMRILVVKGVEKVRWIEFCNKGRDIIKVKNLHDDVWQVELIKRVGDYYKAKISSPSKLFKKGLEEGEEG